jgi:hypothetical protein
MQVPKHLALTGRIKSWLENPGSRLPVSCTTFTVKDSMEGKDGIEDSWNFVSHALRYAAGVAVDLSQLRPQGTENGKGLVASGPCSFAQIYSKLNEILRRGGQYKNGAVTLFLDYLHPDIEQFLNLSPNEIPWAKRAVYVDAYVMQSPHLQLIIDRVRDGSIWLSKVQYDENNERLYGNVCQEIFLKSRGTCLLSHVNLGSASISEIPQAFEDGMEFLCDLHGKTGVDADGYYLPPSQDKQVGLGVIGLANCLAIHGVSYHEFVNTSNHLASAIYQGYHRAAEVARRFGMERAFTIAPTATCSYRYRDSEGYTCAPEISPPNCNPKTKEVIRESETFGSIPYQYHPNTETASGVEWKTQFELVKMWQRMMDSTGLAHAISFNIWDKANVDKAFIQEWLNSPLKTTYYRLQTQQSALDKSQIPTCNLDGECTSCAE